MSGVKLGGAWVVCLPSGVLSKTCTALLSLQDTAFPMSKREADVWYSFSI